ncbi:MAG: hypothetical protein ABI644_07830 [Arenimonas sp.]
MKNETVSPSVQANTKAQRLTYTSPSLKVYGQLRDLTDGGSGAVTEGMAMTNTMRKP